MSITLIYCQGGNRRSMSIARGLGWASGLRSDDTLYDEARPVGLLDCHWERLDWRRHIEVARSERPRLAIVPDTLSLDELPRTLAQAEELALHGVEAVLIVPKVAGLTALLPRVIGGKDVRLAYSVPTRYGGVGAVPLWDFTGWPVHLLGGRPAKQVELAHYLDVRSADGNLIWKIAVWGIFYDRYGKRRTILEADGKRWPNDQGLPYEALRRSLASIPHLWRRSGFSLEMPDNCQLTTNNLKGETE